MENNVGTNKWIKNIIYLLLIVVLYFIGESLLSGAKEQIYLRMDYNFYTLTLFTLKNLLFFGGIGVVLGADKFISELKKTGKWRFNVPKLIILGMPTLIMSIPILSTFCLLKVVNFINLPFSGGFTFTEYIISAIIFGHTVVSSMYKD